jgi:uncharacterized membrane protein
MVQRSSRRRWELASDVAQNRINKTPDFSAVILGRMVLTRVGSWRISERSTRVFYGGGVVGIGTRECVVDYVDGLSAAPVLPR